MEGALDLSFDRLLMMMTIGRFCCSATRLLNEGVCVLQRFIGLCGIQPDFSMEDLKNAFTFSTNRRLRKGNRQMFLGLHWLGEEKLTLCTLG